MIEIKKYDYLTKKVFSTIKETSKYNKSDLNIINQVLIDSDIKVINFDTVKDNYIKTLGLKTPPKSNDALYISDKKIVFFEFKSGNIGEKEKFELRKKIYDSILIFTDIFSFNTSDMRKKVDYILVYIENGKNKEIEEEKKEIHVASSKGIDFLSEKLGELGNNEYIKFGLDIFKDYCLREVHTYTKEKFEELFVNVSENQTDFLEKLEQVQSKEW